jgi:hypothetical protein
MSYKYEIFRAFFVAFGAYETFSNFIFLTKKNGMVLAARQHQELPSNVKDNQLKTKVLCMFAFGILFLLSGLYSYVTHSFHYVEATITLTAFAVYGVIEGCYYRHWKTIGFSCVSMLFLLMFLII